MDADALRARIEEEKRTELDRLGSSKLLVGLTDADLTRRSVLELAANSEFAARETFREWADGEDDPDARAAFQRAADQEDDHYQQVVDLLDESFEPSGGGVLHAYLRGRTDTVERVGAGMVGRPLYSLRAYTQIVSFFVNEADETTADAIRALKQDTEATVDRGGELLEAVCEDEADWDRAAAAAEYAVQLVYDDYADALTELGLDVKSVC